VSTDTEAEQQVCEFCGLRITPEREQCPALDEGVCLP